MNYGTRLAQALRNANKTRARLAAELGVSVQAVGQVITGGRNGQQTFNASHNVKAAKFLEVDPGWLATGEGDMRPKDTWPFERLSSEQIHNLSPEHRKVVEKLALNLLEAQPPAPSPKSPDIKPAHRTAYAIQGQLYPSEATQSGYYFRSTPAH